MKPFSPNAQRVITLSREESSRLKHDYVGSEHLLLGIIQLGEGTAVSILKKLGIDLGTVRQKLEQEVTMGKEGVATADATTYTPGAKQVFNLAAKEAGTLNHPQVGTEHLLLGLLREEEGPAALALKKFQVDPAAVRKELSQRTPPTPARREIREPLALPSTGKRDAVIAIVLGLVILAFIGYGVMHMAAPVQGNKLTGVIIEKIFTPLKEQQISFSGRKIEGTKEVEGEFVFKVRVDSQNRTYEVPVEKPLYDSKKVGDSMTFLRPPSEQH